MPEKSMMAMSAGFNSPSGIRAGFTEQGNSAIQASIGAPNTGAKQTYIGTSQNTPPGPPIWSWNIFDFMYNAYYEKGGFFDGTALVKSIVEKDDQYFERRRVSFYENYLKPIIDATYLPVFSSPIKREIIVAGQIDKDGKSAPLIAAFLKDVDRRGTTIDEYTKKIIKNCRILGSCFVIVDNFQDIPELLEQAIKDRKFPFLRIRLPQQVEPDLLKLDDSCQIEEIAFREMPVVFKDARYTIGNRVEDRWKKWAKNYCVMLKKDKDGNYVEINDTLVAYNLSKCPVIPVYSSDCEDGTIMPQPPYYSIARCNWSLYNDDSAHTRLQRSQMFAILCAPKMEGGFASGPGSGFELPANNTQTGESYPLPFYLAPPVGPYQEIGDTIKRKVETLFRLAGQEGIVGIRESKSGIAKAFDFSAEEWVLKETAKIAEYVETKVYEIYKLYTSENFESSITYTSDYKPANNDDRVNRDGVILDKVSTLSTPFNPIVSALIKDLLEVFYEGNDEDKKEIIEWIDQNTDKAQQGSAGIPPTPDELESGGVKELLAGIIGKFSGKKKPDESKKEGEVINAKDTKKPKMDDKNAPVKKQDDKKEAVTK